MQNVVRRGLIRMESSPTVSDSPLQTNGKKKHTLIIAEAGINMQGSLLQAKRMVDAAVKADADIFKMQKYDPVRLLGPNSPFLLDAQSGQFSRLEYGEMSHYCSKKGIEFLVTLFTLRTSRWVRNTDLSGTR